MSRDVDHHPQKEAEKPDVGQRDRLGEEDKEGLPASDASKSDASLIDTVSDPDIGSDPAHEIKEKGEPFDGNHA